MILRLSIAIVLLAAATSLAAEPVDIGSRRELFVDRYLIDTMTGTTLQLHRPTPAEVVLRREHPGKASSPSGT